MIRRAERRPGRSAAAAYLGWRPERDAIRAAYRVSTATTTFGEPLAMRRLSRRSTAGSAWQTRMPGWLVSRVGHPSGTGSAHQTAFTQALPGAWERR
jgi:hypothetical protein